MCFIALCEASEPRCSCCAEGVCRSIDVGWTLPVKLRLLGCSWAPTAKGSRTPLTPHFATPRPLSNPPQPSTTLHNPPQPSTTLHNPPQPSTTLHNPPPQPSTALHSPPQPSTTLHNPPQPSTALHNPPQPSTTLHNPPQPSSTAFHNPPQPSTNPLQPATTHPQLSAWAGGIHIEVKLGPRTLSSTQCLCLRAVAPKPLMPRALPHSQQSSAVTPYGREARGTSREIRGWRLTAD